MGDSLKLGLQVLLVQPSGTALLALRAACFAAGAVVPGYLAYKAIQSPGDTKAKDRALRLLVANGALGVAERALLVPCGVARWRQWPAAKLAVMLFFLLEGGKGANSLFDSIARLVAPYERDIDAAADGLRPILSHLAAGYLIPLRTVACGCAAAVMAGCRLAHARLERSCKSPWGRAPVPCLQMQQQPWGEWHRQPWEVPSAGPCGEQQRVAVGWQQPGSLQCAAEECGGRGDGWRLQAGCKAYAFPPLPPAAVLCPDCKCALVEGGNSCKHQGTQQWWDSGERGL